MVSVLSIGTNKIREQYYNSNSPVFELESSRSYPKTGYIEKIDQKAACP